MRGWSGFALVGMFAWVAGCDGGSSSGTGSGGAGGSGGTAGAGGTGGVDGGTPACGAEAKQCAKASDCVLRVDSCCFCGSPELGDVVAVHSSYSDACSCKIPNCGPGCPTLSNHYLGTTCNAGVCEGFDVRKVAAYSGCGSDIECTLRRGLGCCEACEGSEDELVAVKTDQSTLTEALCGTESAACKACVPAYPPDRKALCANGLCETTTIWAQVASTTSGSPRVATHPTGVVMFAVGAAVGSTTVGGETLQSAGSSDLFVTKWLAGGGPMETLLLGGTGAETLGEVTVDPEGAALVAGHTVNGGSFAKPLGCAGAGLFVVKFSSGGTLTELWSRCIALGASSSGEVTALATTATGDLYLGGRYKGTADFGIAQLADSNWQGFIAKLSGVTGAPIWVKQLTSSDSTPVRGLAAVGADVFAIGDFSNTLDLGGKQLASSASSSDVVVARFSGATGTALGARSIGDTGNELGLSITKNLASGLVVTGAFTNQVDFGMGPVSSKGAADGFVVGLDASTLVTTWATTFGSPADDRGVSISAEPNGEVALAARVDGPVDFGAGPLAFAGGHDFVIARYSPAGMLLSAKAYGGPGDDQPNNLAWSERALVFGGNYMGSSINFGSGYLPEGMNGVFAHLVP